jgi:hypothetical protein
MDDALRPTDATGTRHCVACYEGIHLQARLCPHCGSQQNRGLLRRAGAALRWVGGATAIISLALAASQITGMASEWAERNDAVARMVSAAKIQANGDNLALAWATIRSAIDINASSPLVLEARIDLAQRIVREWRDRDYREFEDAMDEILTTLYLGAASDDGRVAADAFAHLAWVSREGMRRAQLERMERFLQSGLALDPTNPFANAISGYVKLVSSDQPTPAAIIAEADERFARARTRGEAMDFVDEMEFEGLLHCCDLEVFERMRRRRERAEEIPHFARLEVRRRLGAAALSRPGGFDSNRLDDLRPVRLLELADLFAWLAEQTPPFLDDYEVTTVRARFHELDGDDAKARALYDQAIEEHVAVHGKMTSTTSYSASQRGLERIAARAAERGKGGMAGQADGQAALLRVSAAPAEP